MKNNTTAGLVAALIGGYLLLVGSDVGDLKLPEWGGGGVRVIDSEPLVAPTGALLDAVKPIVGAVADKSVRAQLAALHVEMGNQIERDTENITTTGMVEEFNDRVGQLYFQKFGRSLESEAPGIQTKMNTAFETSMGGKGSKNIDAATRTKIVATYKAIAWALTQ